MAAASQSLDITASADPVWTLFAGFDNLPLWLKVIAKSTLEEGGRVRRLVTVDGAVIVERLLSFDDADRRLTYAHVEGPDPVTGYEAVMSVTDLGLGRARVTWSSTFTPVGWTSEEATAHYSEIYRTGLLRSSSH